MYLRVKGSANVECQRIPLFNQSEFTLADFICALPANSSSMTNENMQIEMKNDLIQSASYFA